MPHKQALHLPSMLTAKAVYERMQLDLVQTISQAQFYKLWSQHFPHVTIPAVSALLLPVQSQWMHILYEGHFGRRCNLVNIMIYMQENRFAKCDTCSMLKEEKEKTTDMKRKKELQVLLDGHLALQR